MVDRVAGYVLAGGKSSRMGRDKALLELAGRPLVEHAVERLRRVCHDVYIVGARPELGVFAPVIPDIHPGCGPLGGIEAALVSRRAEWSLFTPVDMPFLPSKFLMAWVKRVSGAEDEGARVSTFTVNYRPQPVPCLVHRDATSFIRRAVESGELKLYRVLEGAARALADEMKVSFDCVLRILPWSESTGIDECGRDMLEVSKAQMDSKHLWFANLNTREEFADAEKHLDALDLPLKSNVLG